MNQPFSYIHPSAKLADTVIVEPFVSISKNVEIGAGTWIGPHVTIMEGARIGKNCKIFPGAVISAVPQDLKYKGEDSTVEIGNNVIIREYVTVNRGTAHSMKTSIGNNTMLMAYVHIAHDCMIGDNCILANNVNLAGHITIEDYAILGGACNIQQFTKIGKYAFLSGGSLVNKDIPPFVRAARHPTAYAGVNSIGLRRKGFSNEQINAIHDIYRILYLKGLNTSNALKLIETEIPSSPEKDEIVPFIRESVRGIMKGFNSKYED
ncbi:MAG: acyl-ACP--UDP-N-acetylglucosamine O-acyltransferase [Chitinophagales bacterium]|jgi:UDP-N-acetylglucosamine acyltransferase|nr:acyl-ACP--UDP-N-acetylglucosamine O-acyltransferase [Chitinophagales bacterium]